MNDNEKKLILARAMKENNALVSFFLVYRYITADTKDQTVRYS